jgi:phage shock protein PspC (stress-responsive transcriptional regulator)
MEEQGLWARSKSVRVACYVFLVVLLALFGLLAYLIVDWAQHDLR